jgi:hypothetical protein
MPYKAKNGEVIPNCCLTPANAPNLNQWVHADPKCCGFDVTCCKFNCSCLAGICGACVGPCTPVCEFCKGLEGKCDFIFELGPDIPCKTVGGEITLGMKALEDLFGLTHLATTRFPGCLPSALYPFCVNGSPPCCVGQDEVKKDDDFEHNTGEVVITNVKCGRALCDGSPACRPHATLSQGICGLCMDPIFAGNVPFWYCTETVFPPKFTKKGGLDAPIVE